MMLCIQDACRTCHTCVVLRPSSRFAGATNAAAAAAAQAAECVHGQCHQGAEAVPQQDRPVR
jgi:hypothetical protein